jgi:hypothetical protein
MNGKGPHDVRAFVFYNASRMIHMMSAAAPAIISTSNTASMTYNMSSMILNRSGSFGRSLIFVTSYRWR